MEKLNNWNQFLLDESNLTGQRANLELANAAAEVGALDCFRRYLDYDADEAPYGSALLFLPLCGVIGLGRILSEGHLDLLQALRIHTEDTRWRVREGVAMALQDLERRTRTDFFRKWKSRVKVLFLNEERLLRHM